MFGSSKFWLGLWAGASVLAYVIAAAFLYVCTGKLLLPRKRGASLVSVERLSTLLRR